MKFAASSQMQPNPFGQLGNYYVVAVVTVLLWATALGALPRGSNGLSATARQTHASLEYLRRHAGLGQDRSSQTVLNATSCRDNGLTPSRPDPCYDPFIRLHVARR